MQGNPTLLVIPAVVCIWLLPAREPSRDTRTRRGRACWITVHVACRAHVDTGFSSFDGRMWVWSVRQRPSNMIGKHVMCCHVVAVAVEAAACWPRIPQQQPQRTSTLL